MKIMILGSGLVGAPMARDLAEDSRFQVAVADIQPEALAKLAQESRITAVQKDLSKPANLKKLISDYHLVINALPGFMGFQTLKTVIEARKDVIDISFFSEDPFELDSLAKSNNVTAIVDCGVSPGMSNVLIGHVNHLLDSTDSIEIFVGGLPETREWPYEYKASFSPADVIEEYIRPARFMENGKLVEKPALSDPEYINFPQIGTLEAFLTDGLRTLVKTIHAPHMVEKTLRYPGHAEKMKMLRETGFFRKQEISVNGVNIKPVDMTAALLFPKWKLNDLDKDLTVMMMSVEGRKKHQRWRYVYKLLDRYDGTRQIHSMARTTGYTATVALRMASEGLYTRKGISPPEYIGQKPQCVEFMLKGLKQRGVVYEEKAEKLD
ncbi:MAG: saccharopine dehydrogenase C-terminal domain-containing protein [Candidatus Aminicenantes bacterium]